MSSILIFFFGILPLLLFAIVDSFATLNTALIVAALVAVVEAIVSYLLLGSFDTVTLFSMAMVIVMAGLAAWRSSALIFKLQPVILNIFVGGFCLGSYWLDQPIFYVLANKYAQFLPEQFQAQIQTDLFSAYLVEVTKMIGYAMLVLAAVIGYTAVKMSKWWWLTSRIVGFYTAIIIAGIVAMNSAKEHLTNNFKDITLSPVLPHERNLHE